MQLLGYADSNSDYSMQYIVLNTVLLLTLLISNASDSDLLLEKQELLKVAKTLSASLDELRKLESAKASQLAIDTLKLPYPQGGNMDHLVTIEDWEGPLESLLAIIAQQYHYKLNLIGRTPALPILVSISAQNKTLGKVIQDADLQAGNRAHILVSDSPEPTIELRYVTNPI